MVRFFAIFLACIGSAAVVSTAFPLDEPGGWAAFAAILAPMALLVMAGEDEGALATWARHAGHVLQALLAVGVCVLAAREEGITLGFATLTVFATMVLLPLPGLPGLPSPASAEARIREGRGRLIDKVALVGIEGLFMWGASVVGGVLGFVMALVADPVTGVQTGLFFGGAALVFTHEGLDGLWSVTSPEPRHQRWLTRLMRSGAAMMCLSLLLVPFSELDVPGLVGWGLAAVGGVGLAALVVAPVPKPGVHWVAAREGVVEFSPHGSRLVHWGDLDQVHTRPRWIDLELRAGAEVEVYALSSQQHERQHGLRIHAEQLSGVPMAVFAGVLSRAREDVAYRKTLPTFSQPDGPPEAVLADLS